MIYKYEINRPRFLLENKQVSLASECVETVIELCMKHGRHAEELEKKLLLYAEISEKKRKSIRR